MHKKSHMVFNRCLAFFTALCFMLLSVNAGLLVSYASVPESSYQIGEHVTATLSESGILFIGGTGDTYDYKNEEGSRAPFYDKRELIMGIEIGEGVTSVGDYLLFNCTNLSSTLNIPASVDRIGERAFSGVSTEEAPSFTYISNQFVETDVAAEIIAETVPENSAESPATSAGDLPDQVLPVENIQSAVQHIVQQEIGEEIFFPGQVGVFKNTESQNASFYNAAVNAGYAEVLSWSPLSFADGIGNSVKYAVPLTENGVFLPEYEETGLVVPDSTQGEYYFRGWSNNGTEGEILAPHSFCTSEAVIMTAQWEMKFNNLKQQSISATADTQVVEISGNLPEGAEVAVTPVELTSELLGLVSQAVGSEKTEILFALDITISAGGIEYQPKDYGESVSVNVRSPKNKSTENLKVIHLAENEDTKQLDVVEALEPQNTADNAVEFMAGNFSLYVGAATGAQEIVCLAEDYSAEYTGEVHTFEVKVSSPAGAKIEYSVDNDTNDTNYSETAPTMTDVGTETVHWKVTAEGYQEKNGINSFSVVKGKNKWTEALTCPDVQYGMTPNPSAKARWGTPTYLYYTDSNQEFPLQTTPEKVGNYYVKAVVDGTDNYDTLESEAVSFSISNTVIYTASGKELQRLDTQQGIQNSSQVTIQADGDITVFYSIQYKPDSINNPLTIEFSKALPEGTKLTMLDICQSHESAPEFFYYSVPQGGVTSIESTKFYKMGTKEQKTFEHVVADGTDEKQVQYQLCVEFPEYTTNITDFTITLKQGNTELTDMLVSVTCSSPEKIPQLSLTGSSGGEKKIAATANITEAQMDVLAIFLLGSDSSPVAFPTGSNVMLGENMIPYTQRGNFAVFTDISTGTYPISVTGLPEGSYKLKVDLCHGNTDTSSLSYPLANSAVSLTTESLNVTSTKYAVKAELTENQSRIVNGAEGAQLKFLVNWNPVSGADLSVTVQRKSDGGYTNLVPESQWTTAGAGIVNSSPANVTVTVPGNTEPGTYRLVFKAGDAQFPYNIIVK